MTEDESKKQILLRLREGAKQQLRTVSQREGVSMADVMRRALNSYFERGQWKFGGIDELFDTFERFMEERREQKEEILEALEMLREAANEHERRHESLRDELDSLEELVGSQSKSLELLEEAVRGLKDQIDLTNKKIDAISGGDIDV